MIRDILSTLGRRIQTGPASANPEQGSGPKAVFIIDDSADSLRAMSRALAGESYRLDTADNAELAMRKLSSFRPDLILLDPEVPAADGSRLARHLLADEVLAAVPIIALIKACPGMCEPPSVGRFDGHIEKPGEARTFSDQVRTFLEPLRQTPPEHPEDLVLPHPRTSDRRSEAAALLNAIEAHLPDSQFAPNVQNRLQVLADVVGGLQHGELAEYLQQAARLSNAATARARSRFRSLIRLCGELADRDNDAVPGLTDLRAGYMKHRAVEMEALDQALKNGDFDALRRAGHNLKGTGAAYGFSELTDIGRALEAAAKGGDAAAIQTLLDQIDSYISIVLTSTAQ